MFLTTRQCLQQRGRSDLTKVGHQGKEVANTNGVRVHRLSCFGGGVQIRSGIPCLNICEPSAARDCTANWDTFCLVLLLQKARTAHGVDAFRRKLS